jgi:hypothetical protein
MVHVSVAQTHRSGGQHRSGAQSHIECEIKFRDVHHRFLASDADTLDAVGRNEEEAHLPLAGRRLWNHVESPVAALSRGKACAKDPSYRAIGWIGKSFAENHHSAGILFLK